MFYKNFGTCRPVITINLLILQTGSLEAKRSVISPTTVRCSKSALAMLSPKFAQKNLCDITAIDVQVETNRLAKERSPKTVRNYHGFISAVLATFRPSLKIYTTLPQKVKSEPYIPSDKDVSRILEHAKGTEYEIALCLACYGLRRSEICALTLDDIDGDVLTISKAKVMTEDSRWINKTTKTTASTRKIVIPLKLAEKIREKGYIYKGHPNSITKYLIRVEQLLDIPRFPIHKLRHYFASKMSSMGVPEESVMKMGGWETDYVMKGVYRHAMEDKNKNLQREAAGRLADAIFSEQIS